jgi:hypothetical protein
MVLLRHRDVPGQLAVFRHRGGKRRLDTGANLRRIEAHGVIQGRREALALDTMHAVDFVGPFHGPVSQADAPVADTGDPLGHLQKAHTLGLDIGIPEVGGVV